MRTLVNKFNLIFLFGLAIAMAAATTALAESVTLAWDANSESALNGYRVYYREGTSGPPFDGTGADQGDSGIQSLPR